MPQCTFTTNLPAEDVPASFDAELAREIARVLNKGIEVVTVIVKPGARMYRNGTSKMAMLTVWSINVFDAERNPAYGRAFKDLIAGKLGLSDDSIIVRFHDLKREQIGWPNF